MKQSLCALTLAVLTAWSGLLTSPVEAASHREAPLIANDPTADITDFYMFRSWEDPNKVVLIMNVIPGQEPSSGPNYYNFSDDVLYSINLDTNADGIAEDVVYEFRFKTEIRPPLNDLPVAYAGLPPITALDGPGSEGLGLRQRYTVTEVRPGGPGFKRRTDLSAKKNLFAVPSNAGPATIPDYEKLAAQGIYDLGNGGRVFAGQRDETFYIDLGATFDTLNFRQTPILSDEDDADDSKNPFGVDMFSGFNVNTIAIEVPISALTRNANAVIGAYASTSRQTTTLRKAEGSSFGSGHFVQVARLANPLVNELIIGTGSKDRWNALGPEKESQFVDFYTSPRLATVINLAVGTTFPTTGRTDLVAALLKYPGQDPNTCTAGGPTRCSELLRLNLGIQPTLPENQKRLGGLVGDLAGFPNGRRPNDDVTDIALRVVAGALLGSVPNLGDGVNFNIGAPGTGITANGIATNFPFLPTPYDGRNRRHIDPGE